MDRHAAHRDRLAVILAARGQRDVEAGRRDLGVVEEQFEEVAHAVEEQSIAGLRLERQYCAIIGVGASARAMAELVAASRLRRDSEFG